MTFLSEEWLKHQIDPANFLMVDDGSNDVIINHRDDENRECD